MTANHKMTSFNLPMDVYRNLKIASALQNRPMVDIIVDLIDEPVAKYIDNYQGPIPNEVILALSKSYVNDPELQRRLARKKRDYYGIDEGE